MDMELRGTISLTFRLMCKAIRGRRRNRHRSEEGGQLHLFGVDIVGGSLLGVDEASFDKLRIKWDGIINS